MSDRYDECELRAVYRLPKNLYCGNNRLDAVPAGPWIRLIYLLPNGKEVHIDVFSPPRSYCRERRHYVVLTPLDQVQRGIWPIWLWAEEITHNRQDMDAEIWQMVRSLLGYAGDKLK